jgi:CRISPR-associated protein Cas8a1/Csx13
MAKHKTTAAKSCASEKPPTEDKSKTSKKVIDAPSKMELRLYAPGMDVMLRAGLGGLAAVLQKIDDQSESIPKKSIPGWPWEDDTPPWKIENERIEIDFGKPQLAGEFLKRLFEFAFQTNKKEEAIDLPATYGDGGQLPEVRAQLQRGLMLTFLQHGQSRKTAAKDIERSYDVDGKQVTYSIRPVQSYKHQKGYLELVDIKTGMLTTEEHELPGTLYPGAAVRHNKFNSQTKHEATLAELLAAYFAMIGTLALPVNRGSAVLLVPHVNDLVTYSQNRLHFTPKTMQDCFVGGVGDAILGVYARVGKTRDISFQTKVPAISAYLFQPTAWASQQKSRVAGTRVEPLDEDARKIYGFAETYFQSSLKSRMVKEEIGKGTKKTTREVEQPFWSHSIVKPLIAENLANRRPWFENFSSLFTRKDPSTGKPLRPRLFFEKEGLAKMVKADVWSDEGQCALVEGVQFALSCQFGKISGEFKGNPQGMKNKFQKEFEKWRIQFVSAKTAEQFRFSICDLMSRAKGNEAIQQKWQTVLPLMNSDWQLGRDLALLALASYKGKGSEIAPESVQDVDDTED